MKAQNDSGSADLYFEQIRLALNNYHDPNWLGENSPFATPYFLGSTSGDLDKGVTALGRGQLLQKVIQMAADSLWAGELPATREDLETAVQEARQDKGNKGSRYHYFLLEIRYLRRYFRSRATPAADNEKAVRAYLGVGRGPYFNHLKKARYALGEALIQQCQPTFRLEQPPQLPDTLIGREDVISQCLAHLQQNKTVALTGSGGVGKTTVSAHIAATHKTAVFWFTLRPTLNDQLHSLLFSLGYFLHKQGASSLWLQLIADNSQIDNPNLAVELIRGDLHNLPQKPLICLDEVEHLVVDVDKMTTAHQQINSFLEALRHLTPLLLIGQKTAVLPDINITLNNLTELQLIALLRQNNISFTEQEAQQLFANIGGNTRMVWLCIAQCRNGQTLTDVLKNLPNSTIFQTLFARVWQTLSVEERSLLQTIAVYRNSAPEDAFTKQTAIIKKLSQHHLLQQDGQGGLSLIPIIHNLIYENPHYLPAGQRDQAHLAAAHTRAIRGEITSAAYHFLQAGEPILAVQVWYPHREQAIKRGQIESARFVFNQISPRRLPDAEKQALAVIKAEFAQFSGTPEEGLRVLQNVGWQDDSETAVKAHLLQGEFLKALGQPDTALNKLEEGINIITRLEQQVVQFREARTLIHIQQRQIQDAIHEVRRAQFTAEFLQALIFKQQGQYDDGYLTYQKALTLARSIDYELGIAQTNREIAIILAIQSRFDEAQCHLQETLDYYESIGDSLSWEKARNTLSGIHFRAGDFKEVITINESTLHFFEQAKIPFYAAIAASNLAEAYFETGNLKQAEFFALKTLSFEESHPYPYALYTLSLVHRAHEEFNKAEVYCRQSYNAAQDNSDGYMEAYALRLWGELLADLGETSAAKIKLQLALNQFNLLNVATEVATTEKLLSNL